MERGVDCVRVLAPDDVKAVYEVEVRVPKGVRMVMTEDAILDEQWMKMSAMGMSSSLDRLAKVLEARHVHG